MRQSPSTFIFFRLKKPFEFVSAVIFQTFLQYNFESGFQINPQNSRTENKLKTFFHIQLH